MLRNEVYGVKSTESEVGSLKSTECEVYGV